MDEPPFSFSMMNSQYSEHNKSNNGSNTSQCAWLAQPQQQIMTQQNQQLSKANSTNKQGGKHPSKSIHSAKKHFTKEEDEKLKYLVSVLGENDWAKVSQYMPGRQPRQCRERYIGYLMPSLVTAPWTKEEDELLIKKYEELGPKWVKFVQFFPGRSDSNIKNRWHKKLKNIYYGKKQIEPLTEKSPQEIAQMDEVDTKFTQKIFEEMSDDDSDFFSNFFPNIGEEIEFVL